MDEFLNQSKKFLSFPLVKWFLIGIATLIAITILIPPLFTKAKEGIFGVGPDKRKDDKEKDLKERGWGIRASELVDITRGLADALHTRLRPVFGIDISELTPWSWFEDEESIMGQLDLIKSKEEFREIANIYPTETADRNLILDIKSGLEDSDWKKYEWLWN